MKGTTMTAAEKFGDKKKEYEELIKEALRIQALIEPAKKRLDEIKETFKIYFGTEKSENQLITPSGIAELKVGNSYSVIPEELKSLEKIFKDEIDEYVTTKTSFGVSTKFKNLLANGDYKHAEKIRKAVAIKQTYSVGFIGLPKK